MGEKKEGGERVSERVRDGGGRARRQQLPAGWSLPDLHKVQQGSFSHVLKKYAKNVYHLFPTFFPLHLGFLFFFYSSICSGPQLSFSLLLKDSSVFSAGLKGTRFSLSFLRTAHFVVTPLALLTEMPSR